MSISCLCAAPYMCSGAGNVSDTMGNQTERQPGAFVHVGGTGSVPGLMIMHSLSSLIAHRISKGRKDSLRGYISCISTKRRSKVS